MQTPSIELGEDAMDDIVKVVETPRDLTEPVTVGVEAHTGGEYARAERDRAYYNVCSHRGRRLVDTPKGAKRACGVKMSIPPTS
jgi:hypothetical protein